MNKSSVARDTASAVRSHQSYESSVVGICHHSGRYLTRGEINPGQVPFLQARHEFPGLPMLDKLFGDMVHSAEHEHWSWSKPTIRGMAALLSAALLFYLANWLSPQQTFVNAGLLATLFQGLLALLRLASAGVGLYGLHQIANRNRLYHEQATRDDQPPLMSDYPVQGTYKIEAKEVVSIHLSNVAGQSHVLDQQYCSLAVTIVPTKQTEVESYRQYRSQYSNHEVGDFAHAGTVALEKLQGARFADDQIEFRHRLPLRTHISQTSLDSAKANTPFTLHTNYQVTQRALNPLTDGTPRLLLRCEPRLVDGDSRSLELHFEWLGESTPAMWLEHCHLTVPRKLKRATGVAYGRIQHAIRRTTNGADGAVQRDKHDKVIWRMRRFNRNKLVLQATFENPLLVCSKEVISADFLIRLDDYLLSGMEIRPNNVFNAWGRRIETSDCFVRRKSMIQGTLTIDPQRLTQEHEHVRSIERIMMPLPPDEQVIELVVDTLLGLGFDIHTIAQKEPRLDLEGAGDQLLVYWDIVGRAYHPDYLDPIDLHIIVAGYEAQARPWVDDPHGFTQIDLTVRCIHDPRNTKLQTWADSIIDQQDAHGLVGQLRQRLNDVVAARGKRNQQEPADAEPAYR